MVILTPWPLLIERHRRRFLCRFFFFNEVDVFLSLQHYWRLLATYLRAQIAMVAALTGLLLGGIGLQLIHPQVVRSFIDASQNQAPVRVLITIAGIFLGLVLIQRIIGVVTSYVGEQVAWRATNALRSDLLLHCLRLDLPFHQRYTPGELIERIDGDVTALANFFSQLVIKLVGNALLVLGVLLMIWREDWRIALGLLVYVLVSLLALAALQRVAVRRWARWSEMEAEMASFVEEQIAAKEDLRGNGGEGFVMRRFFEQMRRRLQSYRRAYSINLTNQGVARLLYLLCYLLGLGMGAWLLLQGQATIGTVFLIVSYIALLSQPLAEIRDQVGDLQQATASMDRVDQLLQAQPDVQDRGQARLPAGPLGIECERASFGYKSEDGQATELVLNELSLQLKPGRILGVLGRTGSGKTTFSRLLLRLYDLRSGELRIGGLPIQLVALEDLRARVALVTQDVQLFRASLRQNLTLFDETISDARLLEVMGQVGLDGWLASLEHGLDSQLDAESAGLSAGQAQLLAFARVFLKDAGLVVLDEASSRLDPLSSRLMERALDQLFENRSGVIIAHRLETLERADDILILEYGRVLEYGERTQLVADPNSRFAQLLRSGIEEVL
jgi:ATP-binding cassette subfamily B protein